ncbi:MAG: hypothetical protein U5L96_15855 [Owenweeksia sp.]|nr:hypothetical protein [Owenweeksia sp.]
MLTEDEGLSDFNQNCTAAGLVDVSGQALTNASGAVYFIHPKGTVVAEVSRHGYLVWRSAQNGWWLGTKR